MKKHLLLIPFTLLVVSNLMAQEITKQSILNDLKAEALQADNNKDQLLTSTGFNILMQKKSLNYLTGISDLSLAKVYATYGTDNDKLTLGFNIPAKNPSTNRLAFIINPIVEADLKNNFSILYKDKKAKNNVRAGLKATYLFPFSTMNFVPAEDKKAYKVLRAKKFAAIEARLNSESNNETSVTLLDGSDVKPDVKSSTIGEMKEKERQAFEEMGNAETDYLEKEKSYTWLQTAWISAWGFLPVMEQHKLTSPNNLELFENRKFNLWEINLHGTYLADFANKGTFYLSGWVKNFNNNSANADLMTPVDYGQYSQFPGSNPMNFALLETNKAFIGDYKEFRTTNTNLQLVYMTAFDKILIKPGLSFRYEKNWGDYDPINLRFGLPLSIQGKEKPFNIEVQYRINDISNYKNIADHSPTKIIGVSFGLPITLLYK